MNTDSANPTSVPVEHSPDRSQLTLMQRQFEALTRSSLCVELDLRGNVIKANEQFCELLGYQVDEVEGRPYEMFVDQACCKSEAFAKLWSSLGQGQGSSWQAKHICKDGSDVWLSGTMASVADESGSPASALYLASDDSPQRHQLVDLQGQLDAFDKTHAIAEFDLDGNLLIANRNFLNTLGYQLSELEGKHHRLFVDPEFAQTPEYEELWQKMRAGQSHEGEFERLGQGGRSVWWQAAYQPIFDAEGKPFKVVKHATDITSKKQFELEAKKVADRQQQEELARQDKADSLLQIVDAAAKGQLDATIDVVGNDALGQMGRGLQTLLDDLQSSMKAISENANTLSSASSELSAVSNEMRVNADNTTQQAKTAAKSATNVSGNVQVVASNVNQLDLSIREISKSASEAASIAGEAVKAAESANETVSQLGTSSAEIGKVVKVINSIAEQTNLLALNATIEAARAGEAGKGFAVVANEVKELAKETAKATEDIGMRIETIQSDTEGAVHAIGEITELINKVNEVSATIASAVEQQSATTGEISRSVRNANDSTLQISENVESVAKAAENTMQGAMNSQQAADELSLLANNLQGLVSKFNV